MSGYDRRADLALRRERDRARREAARAAGISLPVVRWYGIGSSSGVTFREPRNRYMQGRDWGWDATCSCGWDSHTGGAIEARVREAVQEHLFDDHGVLTGPYYFLLSDDGWETHPIHEPAR